MNACESATQETSLELDWDVATVASAAETTAKQRTSVCRISIFESLHERCLLKPAFISSFSSGQAASLPRKAEVEQTINTAVQGASITVL